MGLISNEFCIILVCFQVYSFPGDVCSPISGPRISLLNKMLSFGLKNVENTQSKSLKTVQILMFPANLSFSWYIPEFISIDISKHPPTRFINLVSLERPKALRTNEKTKKIKLIFSLVLKEQKKDGDMKKKTLKYLNQIKLIESIEDGKALLGFAYRMTTCPTYCTQKCLSCLLRSPSCDIVSDIRSERNFVSNEKTSTEI